MHRSNAEPLIISEKVLLWVVFFLFLFLLFFFVFFFFGCSMASRLETHAQRGYMRPHVVSLWSVKGQTKTHFHKIILAQLSSSIYTHIHTHTDREKLCDRDDDDDEGGIFIRLALWFSRVFSLLHLLLLPSVYMSIIFRRNHRAERKKGTLVYILYAIWDGMLLIAVCVWVSMENHTLD